MKTKKGFYFTLIVLFCIILLLLISFQVKREYTSEGIKTRILTANNFIRSMERDASRAVYISGYRTMAAVTSYVASTKNYINENYVGHPITISEVFADALFNGSLDYTLDYPEAQGLLENNTLKDWQDRSSVLAAASNLDLSFEEITPNNLIVTQTDPWNLIISIPVQYNITDPISGVSWKRDTQINASLPLTNTFEDPVYVIELGTGCGTKIYSGENLKPVLGPTCDPTNLSSLLDTSQTGSRYIVSEYYPSYLDRLTGNLSCYRQGTCKNDKIGVASLVRVMAQTCIDSLNTTSSIVDFKYGHVNGNYHVNGMSWIYLDSNDVSNMTIDPACVSP